VTTDSGPPDVSVVLPTYNESESLPRIVPRIVAALRTGGLRPEVIVVDDDSPDGTAEVARSLGRDLPVRAIHRTDERGLATAVLAGFAASEAPVCVVMDADGSHPVEALVDMVRAVRDGGADIAVGSRHVPGGGSRGWPLLSRVKSRVAALPTRALTSLTDPTTGFMAVRRALVRDLALDPVGWKIVLEVVVKAHPARVVEVPIVFADREHGESKQSIGVALQYGKHLAKLYAHRYPTLTEFVRFCAVGLTGMMVDLATVAALKETFALDTRLCAVGGFLVAVTSNYAINRRWTFAGAHQVSLARSYPIYLGANLAGFGVRFLTVHLLIVAFAALDHGHGYLLTNFVGIVLGTLFNYAGAKFVAFRRARTSLRPPPGRG
jgi:dolichol-phosphate mannosyltransferase